MAVLNGFNDRIAIRIRLTAFRSQATRSHELPKHNPAGYLALCTGNNIMSTSVWPPISEEERIKAESDNLVSSLITNDHIACEPVAPSYESPC